MQIFGQLGSNFGAVDVAINSAERLEAFELVEQFGRSEVASVPEFIALGEMAEDGIVEEAVTIGQETDPQGLWYRQAAIYCLSKEAGLTGAYIALALYHAIGEYRDRRSSQRLSDRCRSPQDAPVLYGPWRTRGDSGSPADNSAHCSLKLVCRLRMCWWELLPEASRCEFLPIDSRPKSLVLCSSILHIPMPSGWARPGIPPRVFKNGRSSCL